MPFKRYGLEHAATLAMVAGVALLLTWAVRRSRSGSDRADVAIRITLAALLLGGLGFALANALPIERMREALNPDAAPEFEATASEGRGVAETLRTACKAVIAEIAGPGTPLARRAADRPPAIVGS